MMENIRKSLIYVAPVRTYWKLTENSNSKVESVIGYYPSSIAPRVRQGHYTYFDANGIPMLRDSFGNKMYHWTTICSYALAHWELYLSSAEQTYLNQFISICKFLKLNYEERSGAVVFTLYNDAFRNNGTSCAMNQGEAISVLLRAYELTGEQEYLQLAESASLLFNLDCNQGGVTSNIPGTDVPWYLEAGKYILNGHNYALWGLWELSKTLKTKKSAFLFNQGWKSLEKALSHFDAGYWSWYWVNQPQYMATIMYHNLHIIQLEHLAQITGSEIIASYSKKFEHYATNPLHRLRSATSVLKSKLNR